MHQAKQKLKEIIEEKIRFGIDTISCYETPCSSEVKFNDGEHWKIVNINNARGYRWHKAYVDMDIPPESIRFIIEPSGALYKLEDYKKY